VIVRLYRSARGGTHWTLHSIPPSRVCDRSSVQERQRRNTDWTPRWFKPAKDTTVYQYEATLKECPMWEFTGDYYKQPREPASPEGLSLIFNLLRSSFPIHPPLNMFLGFVTLV